jgi:predicted DNA-binding transcriptional regulator AlpA
MESNRMKYFTLADVQKRLGNRGRSSIYRDLEAGRLPAPVKLGGRLYWIESELTEALTRLAETRIPRQRASVAEIDQKGGAK